MRMSGAMHFASAGRAITGENAADTVPAELKEVWDEACKTGSRLAKTQLFDKWLSAGGDWGK